MTDPESLDVSTVVCPATGVTAREAAVSAVVARDHLGAGSDEQLPPSTATTRRRIAMIEDIRVLTGVLAMELADSPPVDEDHYDPSYRAALVHEATMRSDSFALCAALTVVGLDQGTGRHAEP